MRTILLPLLAAGLLLHAGTSAKPTPRPEPEAQEEHDDAELREAALLRKHGGAPDHAYLAFKQRKAAETLAAPQLAAEGPSTAPERPWRSLGPTFMKAPSPSLDVDTVAGRITAILTHPTSPTTLYVAFNGGVWKSTNADPASNADWTWTCLTDQLPSSSAAGNVSVGDLAMEPGAPETLYMGMGDPIGIASSGFFTSTDGGASWTLGGSLGASTAVHRILALGNRTLVVATRNASGPCFYRSIDGGRSFTAIAPQPAPNLSPLSLVAFTPTYLAMAGTVIDRNGSTRLVFINSRDGGLTWAMSHYPSVFAMPDGSLHDIEPGQIALASGPNGTGYALVGDRQAGRLAQGLLVTTNSGLDWSFRPATRLWEEEFDGRQGGYNMLLTVDTQDPNKLFAAANVGVHRSLDGGRTWEKMTDWGGGYRVWAHADFHMAVWSKTGPRLLFVGNDGGLSVFRDPYRAEIPRGDDIVYADPTFVDNRHNKGLQTHLLYSVAGTMATTPEDARDRVLMGLQDDHTGWRLDTGAGMRANLTYKVLIGTGDGQDVVIHPQDGSHLIAASMNNNINVLEGVGSDGSIRAASVATVGARNSFFTQVVPSPSDPTGNTVFTADSRAVYRSTDFGVTWSPFGTSPDPAAEIRRMAVCPTDGNVVALTAAIIGGTDATGFYTRDGGASWTRFGAFPTTGGTPASTIWGVSAGSNPGVLYATSTAFRADASHLWKSTDAGATWTPLDGSPSASNGYPYGICANFLVESRLDPNTLFVGTEFGLYCSRNGGATWGRIGTGLPLVQAMALWEAPDGSKLRLATYGRGVWELSRVEVGIAPAIANVSVGGTLRLAATVQNSADQSVRWTVKEYGTVAPDGTFTAGPSPATAFVKATALADPTRTATAVLSIVPLPTIQGFSAAKPVVTVGTGTTLLPSFADGQGSIEGFGPVYSGQSVSTGPLKADVSFRLKVVNAAGDAVDATTSVHVVPAPAILTFKPDRDLVRAGERVSLEVAFSGGNGSIAGIGPVASGTFVLTPPVEKTTDFVLTVVNAAGDATAQKVRISVIPGDSAPVAD